MRKLTQSITFSLLFAALWVVDFAPDSPVPVVLVDSAKAIVGRPLTPVSGAGVARRTTRRAVYATSASAAAASEQQAAAAQQAPAQSSQLPAGTTVSALPAGCESMDVDGTSLFNCGGVVYEPKLQSGNLVYVVK